MANQVIIPRALGANGDPVSGALAYFYETGTSTPLAMYSDEGLTTLHDVPLEADSAGVFAQVFYDGATAVKVDVQTPAGASLPGYPIDPAYVIPTDSGAASAVTFSPITDNAATDVQTAIENENARIDAINSAKSGSDASFISGTAGTAGNLAEWNADGDLVDGPDVLDEDDMTSNSSAAVPTQQSVKSYVDNQVGLVPISEAGITSGDADLQIEIPAGYFSFRLELNYIIPATDAVDLHLRVSNDGGSTWESGASAYAYQSLIVVASAGGYASQGASEIVLASQGTVGSDTGEWGVTVHLDITGARSTRPTIFQGLITTWRSDGNIESGWMCGQYLAAEAIDRLQVFASSGNLEGGNYRLWGFRGA